MEPKYVIALVVVLALLLVAAIALSLSGVGHDLSVRMVFESAFGTPEPAASILTTAPGSAGTCNLQGSQLGVGQGARCRLGLGEGLSLVNRLTARLVEGDSVTIIVEICIDGEGLGCQGGKRATLGDEQLGEDGSVTLELPRAGSLLVRNCNSLEGSCLLELE
jgi:hypothetical protein